MSRSSPFTTRNFVTTALAGTLLLMPFAAGAQLVQEEEEYEYDQAIVVTATRQGGAQDIRHFRSVALTSDTLPRPESLTLEGLLGEHDLPLAGGRICDQALCVTGEAMPWATPIRPDDRYLAGIGFVTGADSASLQAQPLNLVAVVDKSGSMAGQPLSIVRESLKIALGHMRDGDQISIILYGDRSHVYLDPTPVGGNRGKIEAMIDAIQSAGSTNMEEGLSVGYETAFATAKDFSGNSRVMLFTDEQPNVGRTDAQSFMGMARAASLRGVGLTTIGVGVQFNGALAQKVSSTRGGNLFFFANRDEAQIQFAKDFHNMVNALAYDLVLTLTPPAGHRITGVYGVPADILEDGGNGAVSVTIGSTFLSSNSGGIFVGLGRDGASEYLPSSLAADRPVLDARLRYVDAATGAEAVDSVSIGGLAEEPSAGLRLAGNLVDEFFTVRAATRAFHREGKPREAYAYLRGLDQRLATSDIEALQPERELVSSLLGQAALYAGYAGEGGKPVPRAYRVLGDWEVLSVDGMKDLARGDSLIFNNDEEMITEFRRQRADGSDDLVQYFAINDREIYVASEDLLMRYALYGNKLRLTTRDGFGRIVLRRATDSGD
ncbi:MAG: VWA domain-containing protein [Pseudomonadota bacterium]